MKIKLFLFFIIFSLFFPNHIFAEDSSVTELNNKIAEYQKKIDELSSAKDTLSNQITIINSQIQLTTLKITQTKANIRTLETEISDLSTKINDLDVSLNQLTEVYISQVAQNYKMAKRYPSLSLFTNFNFNNFLEQYKYISTIQKNSQTTLLNMETVRTNFDLQKEQKAQKQTELQNLTTKLADQQTNLDKQKSNKTDLLEVTKNNEAKYQQLKTAAENELNSLLTAKFVGKRTVKAGDSIGLMGNTGYSFGDHLHFGLYHLKESQLSSWVYANDVDSSDYISHHMWPMNDPITITQGRGATKYSYMYSDHFHHGVDMVSPNKSIRAVSDGVAYFFRNSGSSLGNHVKLFDKDGNMTLYLHMQ